MATFAFKRSIPSKIIMLENGCRQFHNPTPLSAFIDICFFVTLSDVDIIHGIPIQHHSLKPRILQIETAFSVPLECDAGGFNKFQDHSLGNSTELECLSTFQFEAFGDDHSCSEKVSDLTRSGRLVGSESLIMRISNDDIILLGLCPVRL